MQKQKQQIVGLEKRKNPQDTLEYILKIKKENNALKEVST